MLYHDDKWPKNASECDVKNWSQRVKKNVFWGVKTAKKCCFSLFHRVQIYKKYILQKNWVKTAIPFLSSGQSNLQTPIWGCHRQLDDQYRNPNNNNRDHLVGQLTRWQVAPPGLGLSTDGSCTCLLACFLCYLGCEINR